MILVKIRSDFVVISHSGESLLRGYKEFLALVCSAYTSHFHQTTGRTGTQALTSSFRKDKTSFSVSTKPFYSSEYTVSIYQSQIIWKTISTQTTKWTRRNNSPFSYHTNSDLLTAKSHNDCRAAEELVGRRKIVFRGQSKKSRTKIIVIYSVSTDRKIYYSRQFSFLIWKLVIFLLFL